MLNFTISAQQFSDALWPRLVERHQRSLAVNAYHADYVERSIPAAGALALTVLREHVRPKTVIEIGTGIGRSAGILGKKANVWTCDIEDHGVIPLPTTVTVFKNTGSTDMLRQLAQTPVDMFFIDGRVQPDDLPLIASRCKPDTIIALDDCEGSEKGTVNVLVMTNSAAFPTWFYLPPPSVPLFEAFGVVGKHTVGLLVQSPQLNVVRQ